MDDKQKILGALKGFAGPELPSFDGFGIQYPDPVQKFCETVVAVGGRAIRAKDMAEADRQISGEAEFSSAKKVASTVPGLGRPTVGLNAVDDPRLLADLDLMIAPGAFGVAENGAVWVTNSGLKHRAALFIAVKLILVIEAAKVVHNLHQAYERISFDGPGYGAFISGPSKTADIEQALVIGAQGPKQLTVVVLG